MVLPPKPVSVGGRTLTKGGKRKMTRFSYKVGKKLAVWCLCGDGYPMSFIWDRIPKR
jgi:hypothetical protein